ncbi:MAG: sugar phosphate isomerase/epimerase family protein [Acidimicrobiales bacterium]
MADTSPPPRPPLPPRSPADLGPQDLVWDHFSRPRHDDVVARIDAAAGAGFGAIGLYLGAWARLRSDPTAVEAIDAALDRTGLVVSNIEVVRGWASPDRPDQSCLDQEALAYEMADHFGCRYLQAIGDHTGSVAEAAVGFGGLCDRAGEHGLLVGIEWVPSMTNIETAARAAEIVTAADRDNGGFCVDSWHLTRSTNNIDDILQLPGDRVFAVQLNDGTIEPQHPDYLEDCLTNRVPPGDGQFDLVGLIRALDQIGSTAPLGLEVCSTELWQGPVDVAAAVSAQGMRRILAEARPETR